METLLVCRCALYFSVFRLFIYFRKKKKIARTSIHSTLIIIYSWHWNKFSVYLWKRCKDEREIVNYHAVLCFYCSFVYSLSLCLTLSLFPSSLVIVVHDDLWGECIFCMNLLRLIRFIQPVSITNAIMPAPPNQTFVSHAFRFLTKIQNTFIPSSRCDWFKCKSF